MRRLWRDRKRVFRAIRGFFPFTWVGTAWTVGAAVAVVLYGVRRMDLVLLTVGAVAIILSVLCLLATSITALVLRSQLRRSAFERGALQLECGYPGPTGFSVSKLRFVPLVRVTWSCDEPRAKVQTRSHGPRLDEELLPLRRGYSDRVLRRIGVADFFGLTRVDFALEDARPVRFVPSMGKLKSMHVIRAFAAGDVLSHPEAPAEGELIDMRHYNAGDPIRMILWKVFARTRDVVVRTAERAKSPIEETVAYLVAGEGDEPAAGAVRAAFESGSFGNEWVLGADGSDRPARSRAEALDLIARSARVPHDQGGKGLRGFLTSQVGSRRDRMLVFVPGRDGPWLDRVLATTREHRAGELHFIVCTDGVARTRADGLVRRMVLRKPSAESNDAFERPVHQTQLNVVLRKLGRQAHVTLVDRRSGHVFAGELARTEEAA